MFYDKKSAFYNFFTGQGIRSSAKLLRHAQFGGGSGTAKGGDVVSTVRWVLCFGVFGGTCLSFGQASFETQDAPRLLLSLSAAELSNAARSTAIEPTRAPVQETRKMSGRTRKMSGRTKVLLFSGALVGGLLTLGYVMDKRQPHSSGGGGTASGGGIGCRPSPSLINCRITIRIP